MTDGEHDRFCRACNRAEVLRQSENWPSVADGSERRVLGVRKRAVVNELSTDSNIGSCLVGRIRCLRCYELKGCC